MSVTRTDADGPIGVVIDGDIFRLTVEHDGRPQSIEMTEFNARRVLGALSLVLDLPLSKAASKRVMM